MQKVRKIPMRKCIGCGESKPKNELIRVVKNKENEVFLDFTGKAHGRGAYLCKDENCLNKAIKSKGLNRSFGCEISKEAYEELKSSLK
ncbi:YlxR family protein [Peptoniphilus sp. KCTC 25270]|uniref:RNase P modulator RnpM n=1 Tax=Peptoniphilus sp. KCTC 25270 TaxID=2897414 RepID=UPI001E5FA0BB|nr:YlxR family protein [Peptoniphilus sp. KCTC 25270]MCD1146988.1 YlxR family protein [Peptoniphilus sp. KCTC 25270]